MSAGKDVYWSSVDLLALLPIYYSLFLFALGICYKFLQRQLLIHMLSFQIAGLY